MFNEKNNKKIIQEKLATVKYNCSDKTHLVVNQKKCAKFLNFRKKKIITQYCNIKEKRY